jgi:uncharacterized protein
MNNQPEHIVAEIVSASGGRLVSRIRLQKIAYLLEKLGVNTGFDFSYHHFGPYSRELDSALLDAEAFDLIEERFDYRQSDGARYSVFSSKNMLEENKYFFLNKADLREKTKEFATTPITVLELAATVHWLAKVEEVDDWQAEIRLRKGSKTEGGRLSSATKLLADINLMPSS